METPFVDQPGSRYIYTEGWPHTAWMIAVIGAFIALAITTIVVLFRSPTRKTKLILLAFWTLVPPVWFSYEYFGLFRPLGPAGTFDQFKYGQDVTAKFWAGIVALLGGSLLKAEAETQPDHSDKASQLERLVKLRDNGEISVAEFKALKKELLKSTVA